MVEVVAEKTGYPPEMLELDMALEEDLGIDSIKRVEILSAIQERMPTARPVGSEQLGTFRTLRHVVDFLTGGTSGTARTPASPESTSIKDADRPQEPDPPSHPEDFEGSIDRLVPMPAAIDPALDRPRVALAAGSPIWIVADGSPLAGELADHFGQLGHPPILLGAGAWASREVPAALGGLVILSPNRGSTDDFLVQAFELVQRCGTSLRRASRQSGAILGTVSRLDGRFGFGEEPLADPLSGGLAGLTKTACLEWPEVSCKAIDLAEDDSASRAGQVIEELFLSGPVEVGLSPHGRCTILLSADRGECILPHAGGLEATSLDPDEVIVVTGGARGVTAEVALALAQAHHPRLVVLGRTPEPEPEPQWIESLAEPAELQRALAARLPHPATPRDVQAECRRLLAAREVRANLERLRNAVGTADRLAYLAADVRDPQSVGRAIADVRARWGPIRGIVHGAGIILDRRIEDKSREDFGHVYATKVVGLRNLLAAVGPDELRLLVLFSSFTARHGRVGQVDYAVANEVLNKLAQAEARRRPACKVIAVNWGPWEGGMVTPALRKVFEEEGVGLIPLSAGAQFLLDEIHRGGGPVEVVAMGSQRPQSLAPAGGDPAVPSTGAADRPTGAAAVASARCRCPIDRDGYVPAFDRWLDVPRHPFLESHVLDGRAVLPVAMMIEWLAHAAIHRNPGLDFLGFDELGVHRGVRLEAGSRQRIQVQAAPALPSEPEPAGDPLTNDPVEGGTGIPARPSSIVPVRLVGMREGNEIPHASARVLLGEAEALRPAPSLEVEFGQYAHTVQTIYESLLFHGPTLRGIEEVQSCSRQGIAGLVRSAPRPAAWIEEPLRREWLADPLVLDCAFQLMILWTLEHCQMPSLPSFIGRYRQFRWPVSNDGARIVARVTSVTPHQVAADIEITNRQGELVASLWDYQCVLDGSLRQAFRRRELVP